MIGAVAVLLVAAPGRADSVFLKNGQRIEGIITSESGARVVIRTASGELPLPRSMVERVERAGPQRNATLGASGALRTGNIVAGIRGLVDAYEEAGDGAALDSAIVENCAAILSGLGRLREEERAEARYQLKRLRDAPFVTPASLLVVAQAFAAIDAGLEASDALQMAGIERAAADPGTATWARDFLRGLVRRLVLQGRYQDAVEQIERLRLLEGPSAEDQLPLVNLAAAARARDQGDYEEALRQISTEIWPSFPEVARNRALVVLRLMTQWAQAEGRERDASRWIRQHLISILPVESLTASMELVKSEAERHMRHGEAFKAMRLIEQIPENERPGELQRIWSQARFDVEFNDVATSDPLALFRLGQWAAKEDLYDEALLALETVRENPALREAADEQAALVKTARDLEKISEAVQLYQQGLLFEARDLCNELLLSPDRESPVAKQAQELADAARKDLALAKQKRPYQAEVFYQQAERAYFTGSLDESWSLIDLLLTHYADTPAAERAANLLPSVAREFEIQLIEGKRSSVPSYESAVSRGFIQQTDRLGEEIGRLLDAMGQMPANAPAQSGQSTPARS
ncbi:hypothetical protein HZA57_03770 [Candidatus Poribacteria bacterium]|nr:hypothetical protein [Candidatus Poribacteria bacterium]